VQGAQIQFPGGKGFDVFHKRLACAYTPQARDFSGTGFPITHEADLAVGLELFAGFIPYVFYIHGIYLVEGYMTVKKQIFFICSVSKLIGYSSVAGRLNGISDITQGAYFLTYVEKIPPMSLKRGNFPEGLCQESDDPSNISGKGRGSS
jgi:hypothetical protein